MIARLVCYLRGHRPRWRYLVSARLRSCARCSQVLAVEPVIDPEPRDVFQALGPWGAEFDEDIVSLHERW